MKVPRDSEKRALAGVIGPLRSLEWTAPAHSHFARLIDETRTNIVNTD